MPFQHGLDVAGAAGAEWDAGEVDLTEHGAGLLVDAHDEVGLVHPLAPPRLRVGDPAAEQHLHTGARCDSGRVVGTGPQSARQVTQDAANATGSGIEQDGRRSITRTVETHGSSRAGERYPVQGTRPPRLHGQDEREGPTPVSIGHFRHLEAE
ncbi:hypothetical protein [Candidatus Palauibacter sp.]|uniref:hypothetical protein n=1 Tax=Candidatus Palauibacter sp. TaxID=3101350 RepID=UPI003AF22ED0